MKASTSFQYGAHEVTIDTGGVARQADGAVIVTMGDTVVLVTAVGQKGAAEGRDFFPLTVNYQEKTYAAGRIPGGFFKREGRPSEKETLTSRLIDRPVRPLFPKGFQNEVQVIATVMSVNPEVDPDIPALLGASAALTLSGMPFQGPIGAARVGFRDGEYLLNPSKSDLDGSALDLVVAGTANAVLMVESEADVLPEDVMLGAVVYGHEQMQTAIAAIQKLAAEAGNPAWDWQPPVADAALAKAVEKAAGETISAAYQVAEKQTRYAQLADARKEVMAALADEESSNWTADEVSGELARFEKGLVRQRILDGQARIDGRDTSSVRPIDVQVGLLPPHPRLGAVHARGNSGPWWSPHWARDVMPRSLMPLRASAAILSCCITTSPPTAWVRRGSWAVPSGAKLVTASWPGAACRPSCQTWKTFPM